jgi:hypothetical protein
MDGAAVPDRVATELDLFGDFVCDGGVGDSHLNSFSLIEFEDATQRSVLSKLQTSKIMKHEALVAPL